MTQYPRKRKSDLVDLTQDEDVHASKAIRTTSNGHLGSIARSERLGENAEFLPLNQLSQVAGADEEDAEAAELVQGSQDVDESSLSTNILYGKRSNFRKTERASGLNKKP